MHSYLDALCVKLQKTDGRPPFFSIFTVMAAPPLRPSCCPLEFSLWSIEQLHCICQFKLPPVLSFPCWHHGRTLLLLVECLDSFLGRQPSGLCGESRVSPRPRLSSVGRPWSPGARACLQFPDVHVTYLAGELVPHFPAIIRSLTNLPCYYGVNSPSYSKSNCHSLRVC